MSSSDSSTGSPKPKTKRTASPSPPLPPAPLLPSTPGLELQFGQQTPGQFNVDALFATTPVPQQGSPPQAPVPPATPQLQPQSGPQTPGALFAVSPVPQQGPDDLDLEGAHIILNHYLNIQHLMPAVTAEDQANLYSYGHSYLLTGLIGQGAFGMVCKSILTGQRNTPAYQRQEFAIKIQRVWVQGIGAANEINVLNYLSNNNPHPNVIRLIQSIVNDPNSYIVMPLAPVGDLHSQLKVPNNNGINVWRPIRPVYCRHIISGIARGIQYLHQIGVAHGDLKLENTLIFWDQQAQGYPAHVCRAFYWVPKVTDFSNSQLFDPVASFIKQGATCTIDTAAPENWLQNDYDVKPVDAYSVGACMLAMLTGEYTFMPSPIRQLPDFIQQSQALKQNMVYLAECIRLVTDDPDVMLILSWLLEPIAANRMTMDILLQFAWFNRPVGSPGLEEGDLFLY